MFRGKHIDSGGWVFGYYVKCRGNHYILRFYDETGYDDRWESSEWIKVSPESIAQYTTLNDKNDKPIYGSIEIDEKLTKGGDIVQCTGYQHKEFKAHILWDDNICGFELWSCTNGGDDLRNFVDNDGEKADVGWSIEVIGNNIDNSDLLKTKKRGGCDKSH